MKTTFNSDVNYFEFNSVNEFVDYCEVTEPHDSNRKNASHTSDSSFAGTQSWEDAIQLIKYGDERLHNKIKSQKYDVEIEDMVNQVKKSYVNDVVGFMPHVPNAVIGIPQNMIRQTRTFIPNKIVNIFISVGASASVRSEDIQKNASMCAAAINILEGQGYRCNVYVGEISGDGGKRIAWTLKIKTDKQPLNLAMMAFPLSSTSMLRRFGFKISEVAPFDFTHSGYGSVVDNHKTMSELFKEYGNLDNLTIFSVSKNSGSLADMVEQFKSKSIS